MRSLAAIVATMTLVLGACSSDGSDSTADTTTSTTVAQGQPVSVVLKDRKGLEGSMTMIVSPNAATAGTVTFTVKNEGTIEHDFVVVRTSRELIPSGSGTVSEKGAVGAVHNIAAGRSTSLTVDLAKGKYQLLCNIEGHFGRGMHVPFTVRK